MGLDPERKLMLLIGGSQGALALNGLMLEIVQSKGAGKPPLDEWQLLWMTGPRHHSSIAQALSDLGDPSWVKAVPYIEDVPLVLASTDLALSRAGAMTTSEILANGVPAILVPLPTSASNHQAVNARALEESGAAVHLAQAGLTSEALWTTISRLANDRRALSEMSACAKERSRPEATSVIVREMVRLLPDAEPTGPDSRPGGGPR
jgi:UDP-N-acetylglucosamine--N-acetylmuramyl-(pentapeptide) pyrophosphoryl-undecaprenol N-acetylglucosamine transferase